MLDDKLFNNGDWWRSSTVIRYGLDFRFDDQLEGVGVVGEGNEDGSGGGGGGGGIDGGLSDFVGDSFALIDDEGFVELFVDVERI